MSELTDRRPPAGRAVGALHRAVPIRRGVLELPVGLKLAVAALAAVVVLAVAGVLVTATRDGGDGSRRSTPGAVGSPALTAPPTTATPTRRGSGGSPSVTPTDEETSTTVAPAMEPTTPPATTPAPGPDPMAPDPLAACSPDQRNASERGNHPPDWYPEHYDPNGDGVLCT